MTPKRREKPAGRIQALIGREKLVRRRNNLSRIGLLVLLLALSVWPSPSWARATAPNPIPLDIAGPLPAQSADGAVTQAVQLDLAGHLGGKNGDVFVQGHYAYATFGRELAVLDVSDPAYPARVGSALLPGYSGGVYVAGQYAYLSDYEGGFGDDSLFVVDVSDPAHPVEIGRGQTTFGCNTAVYVLGDYAYLVNDDIGLTILDVSDPAHPAEESWYESPGGARDLYVAGGYAYLADDEAGLAVVDVSNPLSPTLAAALPLPGTAHYIAGTGDRVYLTADNPVYQADNFFVVDVSDPEQPLLVGSTAVFDGFPGEVYGVYTVGNYAYVAGADSVGSRWYGGVEVVDVSNPANPHSLSFFASYWVRKALRVHVADGQAYLAGYDDGLLIVNVADPYHLTKTCHYRLPSNANALAVSGHNLYLADGWQGVKVVDVAEPANPVVAGVLGPSAELNSSAQDIVLAGSHAYIADNGGGLRVLDVSDPANPAEVGYYPLPQTADYALHLDVASGYAYLADNSGRLRVFDIANPAQPTPVAVYEGDGYGSFVDVQVVGDYAYTVGNGLRVLDISDPAQASEVGRCPTVGSWGRLHVADGYAYATGGDSRDRLWVVDVSDPASPTAVSTYTLPVFLAGEVHVADHPATGARLAYVTTDWNGLWVVDVSDPANPVVASSFAAWGPGRGVQAVGDAAYLANYDEGLFVLAHSTLKVAPTAVTWLAEVGGADPRPRTVQVDSSGSSLAWTATISPTVSWLEAVPLSGDTPAEVTLTAHIAGLGVGRYEAHLVIEAGVGIVGSPQTISVTLIVAEEMFGSYLPLVLRKANSR